MMHLIDGLVDSRPAVSSGGKSAFEAALAALNPIRWYPLDDFASGIAHDLGSQQQNGIYTGSSFNVTPGMLPTRKHCVGLTAPTNGGISIPATGLPSGAHPWTIGCIEYVTFRAGTYAGLPFSYDGNDQSGAGSGLILYHNGFTTGVTASGNNINVATSAVDILFLCVATYDGTTLQYFLYSPVRLLGNSSTAVALNVTPTNPVLQAGNGNFQEQHAFMMDYALSQAQIANLATNIPVVQ